MYETITKRVIRIISDVTNVDEKQISINTYIDDLYIDTFDTFDIITDIEDEFELAADDITYEDFAQCRTVGDLVNLIYELY